MAALAAILMFAAYSLLVKYRLLLIGVLAASLFTLVTFENPVTSLLFSYRKSASEENYGMLRSTELRGIAFQQLPSILRSVPLLGLGPGVTVRESLLGLYQERIGFRIYGRTEMPAFAVVAIESGILSGVLFLALFFLGLWKSFSVARSQHFDQRCLVLYVFLALLGLFFCFLVNAVFSSLHLLFLLLGILDLLAVRPYQRLYYLVSSNRGRPLLEDISCRDERTICTPRVTAPSGFPTL